MPTGYTAGIVDGEIKTFPEFAKLCMRAFGATVHMRDESMTTDYIPREPSKYHAEQLEEANKKIELVKSLSDEEIISVRKIELEKEKEYHLNRIAETKLIAESLNKILHDAEKYTPPTPDHVGVKDFMIEQIKETIKWDGSTTYHDEKLVQIESNLSNLNPKNIRDEMIANAKKNIDYHKKEQNEELQRCEKSNKWVDDFLKSL